MYSAPEAPKIGHFYRRRIIGLALELDDVIIGSVFGSLKFNGTERGGPKSEIHHVWAALTQMQG